MNKPRLVSHDSLFALLMLAAVGAGTACTPSESAGTGAKGKGGSSGATTGAGGTSGATTGSGGISGGTTGAGGVVVGPGAGGTTGVVMKDCATKLTPMNPTLINFETYDGASDPTKFGAPYGGPTANMFTDGLVAYMGPYTYPENETAPAPTLAILAGHPPSNWAVSETITQAKVWGMGGGFWMGCTNASAYKGISFWVRGSGPPVCAFTDPATQTQMTRPCFSFAVSMDSTSLPNATNPAGGGTCPGTKDTCLPAKASDIPLTADWTQVKVLWSGTPAAANEFALAAGSSGGTAVMPNGDNINGLGWSVPLQFALAPGGDPTTGPYNPVPGDLTINIDDMQFIQ